MVVMMIVTITRVTAALANRIREEEEREGVVQEVMQIFIFSPLFLFSIPGVADGQDRARLSHSEGVGELLQRELEPREDGAGQAIYYYIIIYNIFFSIIIGQAIYYYIIMYNIFFILIIGQATDIIILYYILYYIIYGQAAGRLPSACLHRGPGLKITCRRQYLKL